MHKFAPDAVGLITDGSFKRGRTFQPPRPRDQVLKQAYDLDDWILCDAADDIYIANVSKNEQVNNITDRVRNVVDESLNKTTECVAADQTEQQLCKPLSPSPRPLRPATISNRDPFLLTTSSKDLNKSSSRRTLSPSTSRSDCDICNDKDNDERVKRIMGCMNEFEVDIETSSAPEADDRGKRSIPALEELKVRAEIEAARKSRQMREFRAGESFRSTGCPIMLTSPLSIKGQWGSLNIHEMGQTASSEGHRSNSNNSGLLDSSSPTGTGRQSPKIADYGTLQPEHLPERDNGKRGNDQETVGSLRQPRSPCDDIFSGEDSQVSLRQLQNRLRIANDKSGPRLSRGLHVKHLGNQVSLRQPAEVVMSHLTGKYHPVKYHNTDMPGAGNISENTSISKYSFCQEADESFVNSGSCLKSACDLTPLERLASKANSTPTRFAEQNRGRNKFRSSISVGMELFPAQGTNLKFPKAIAEYGEEAKRLTVQHEFMKERKRDLVTIVTAYREFAKLGCVSLLGDTELDELKFMRTFAQKVAEEGKSGTVARRRIEHLKANAQRRKRKRANQASPSDDAVEKLLDKLIGQPLRSHIEREIEELKEHIIQIGALRQAKREESRGKRRRSATQSNREEPRVQAGGRRRKNQHGKKSVAQLDEEIAVAKHALRKFGHLDQRMDNTITESMGEFLASSASESEQDDSESGVSEETEGEHLTARTMYIRTSLSPQITSTDINNEEQIYPLEKGDRKHRNGQHHPSAVGNPYSKQSPSAKDFHSAPTELMNGYEAEAEFDDLDLDESQDEANNEGLVCYRYDVKLFLYSIDLAGYEENMEHHILKLVQLPRAIEIVQQTMDSIFQEWKRSGYSRIDAVFDDHSFGNEVVPYERMMTFGRDEEARVRCWVEKHEIRPSQEALEKVKVSAACMAKPVYAVLWNKTTEPCVKGLRDAGRQQDDQPQHAVACEHTHSTQDSTKGRTSSEREEDHAGEPAPKPQAASQIQDADLQNNDDDDDDDDDDASLFRGDSEEVSHMSPVQAASQIQSCSEAATMPTTSLVSSATAAHLSTCGTRSNHVMSLPGPFTEHVSAQQIELFTSRAFANRSAFNLLHTWWKQHTSAASRSTSQLNGAGLRHEEQAMEDSVRACEDLSMWSWQAEFIVKLDSDERAMALMMHGLRRGDPVIERLRVWVEEKEVRGPNN